MTDTEQLPEAVASAESVLFFDPTRRLPDPARPVEAPTLAAWQRAWVDGTSWSEDEESDLDLAPWPEFHTSISAA